MTPVRTPIRLKPDYELISSKNDGAAKTTVPVERTDSLSNQLSQYAMLEKQQHPIEAEFSLICLLADIGALDELNYLDRRSQIFIKPYECLSEIVKAADQKLIIIISQSLLKHFIPLIHDLIQIIYIYILHECDSHHENKDENYVNADRYPKVRGSFIEQTMLRSKLHDDLQQLSTIPLRQPILVHSSQMNTSIDFYVIAKQPSSLKSLTGDGKDFVLFQLIIKTILESGNTNPLNNLSASLELCRIFPNNNERKVLREIHDKFHEKYRSQKTIHFYLSDPSLKNEMNTCFGKKNIHKICKLWFFIRDLLKQLPSSKKSIPVYRGQYLTTDQILLLKNNVGSLMTFTKFFSMSTSNIRAIRRSGDGHSYLHLAPVVFQLEIRNDSANTRFSMTMKNNDELIFLFAIGSVILY